MAITIRQRKKKLLLTGMAGILVTATIAILLTALGNSLYFRWDTTQQGTYSLSPASRKLVKELGDPVVITAYFTPDLPPPYNIYERYARDLLDEYRAASRGRVRFEFAIANPPGAFEKKAGEAGLIPIQFEQVGSDQFQVRRGYMGMVLHHRDKTETLPIVKNIQQLEYDLTSRIAKMALRTKKTIAVTAGHGEVEWSRGTSQLAAELSDLYDLRTVTLPALSSATLSADALLVIGPKQKFDEKSLWAIDQAIMRGIPTAFLIDIRNFTPGRFFVMPQDAGLNDLVKHYGIQMGQWLILDPQCEAIGVTQNMAGFAFRTSLRYPFIPLVDRVMNTHPIGRSVEAVGLPFVTSVDPVAILPKGVRFTPILYTSQKSFFADGLTFGSVAPNEVPRPKPDAPTGPFPVGAVLEGTFASYFQSKPVPVPGQTLIATSPKTQIFVLGTSRIVDPQIPPPTGAEGFMMNVLTYLSKDETLIGIRNKGEIIRPLKPVTNAVRQTVKYATVLGAAALSIVLGLWQWRRRQSWRTRIASEFNPPATS